MRGTVENILQWLAGISAAFKKLTEFFFRNQGILHWISRLKL